MKNRPDHIVAVFAHPDDETFICGGTLAKYAQHGTGITLVCATKGESGRRMGLPPFVTRESMPRLREAELREACRLLGIGDLRFLGLRDKLVECEPLERLAATIAEVLRERRPDVVLTFHERIGGHPDHCYIGKATTLAWQRLRDELPGMRLYFISFGDAMRRPERYGFPKEQITEVDITDQRLVKMHAFRAHRSQTELDEGLWGPDAAVAQRFSGKEFFIQAAPPWSPGERNLTGYGKRAHEPLK
jgi:bacillithiol biosynthesis deacetylase BshB2